MKDKRAFIFYFLMTLIFLDFANQIKVLSYKTYAFRIDNPVFSIVHLNNTGSAFSLFEDKTRFLIIFGLLAVLYIAFYVYRNICFEDKFQLLSLTLFSAGTLGNLLERIRQGYVVDYIKLNFINFPVFNTFDIMICIGIFLYLFFVLFNFNFLKFKKEKNGSN